MGDEDAAAEEAESGEDHDPEMVAEGERFAGEADGDGHRDAAAHADAGDEVSAEGRDHQANQINGEQIAESQRGETEGRIGEVKGAVGEGGDEGE